MSLIITGSIATDHLMTFPGRFADSLVVEQLDKIALSFLVDDLEVRRGGCAANIAFGLGNLGLRPVLVGAVGEDFVDYRSWLVRHHVDCDSVRVSADQAHRAVRVHERLDDGADRILLRRRDERGPRDRAAADGQPPRWRHLRPDRAQRPRGHAPAHPRVPGPRVRVRRRPEPAARVRRRRDDPRAHRRRHDPVQQRVRVRSHREEDRLVGGRGARAGRHPGGDARRATASASSARARSRSSSPAVPEIAKVEPTGVGDAFRAGFLAALEWDLSLRAGGAARLPARGVRRGAGRHAGVHLAPAAVRGPLLRCVRRRRRRRDRRARAHAPP